MKVQNTFDQVCFLRYLGCPFPSTLTLVLKWPYCQVFGLSFPLLTHPRPEVTLLSGVWVVLSPPHSPSSWSDPTDRCFGCLSPSTLTFVLKWPHCQVFGSSFRLHIHPRLEVTLLWGVWVVLSPSHPPSSWSDPIVRCLGCPSPSTSTLVWKWPYCQVFGLSFPLHIYPRLEVTLLSGVWVVLSAPHPPSSWSDPIVRCLGCPSPSTSTLVLKWPYCQVFGLSFPHHVHPRLEVTLLSFPLHIQPRLEVTVLYGA